MKLHVLASSSKGNGYLLETADNRFLAMECGVKLSEVKKKVGFQTSKIDGVIMSHVHGDHAKYLDNYLAAGLDVYGPAGKKHHRYHAIESKESITLGKFRIVPLAVIHDVECFCFLITVEGKKIVFVTDTYIFPYNVSSATNFIIEANFSHEIVKSRINADTLHTSLANRIYSSHMEIDTAVDVVRSNQTKELVNVVLIHLSDSNSNEKEFINKMQKATGVPVYAATKNLEVIL